MKPFSISVDFNQIGRDPEVSEVKQMVTSLHDGMNLVAKEFIASRMDGDGLIVLSKYTGCARELDDALLVNPFDVDQLADVLFKTRHIHTARYVCQQPAGDYGAVKIPLRS